MKKSNKEEFVKKVKELVGDEYTVLGDYVNTNTKILMRHNKCGNKYLVTPNKFKQGRRCPACMVCKKPFTNEQFLERVSKLVGDEYTFLEEYKGNDTKIKVRHNKCGYEYLVTPTKFFQGRRCPSCAGTLKKTTKDFKKDVKRLTGKEYKVIGEYINNKTHIKIKHMKCGHIYEVTPGHFLHGNRCPYCYGTNIQKTNEEFLQEVKKLVGDEYTFLEEYDKSNIKIKVRHNKCGHIYEVTPDNFLSTGTRCPYCTNGKHFSKEEKEILSYIKKIYKGKIISNDKKVLKGKELDIYLPELKIAIEFDGLYWHSELFTENNYHLWKTETCEEQGIKLIHIFEDEWNVKKKIVKDKIKTLLRLNTKKIYARECIIKEIDNNTKNIFLEKNHIQGKDNSSIRLGLYTSTKYYDKEVLVAVMTFCKPRKALGQNKKTLYDYELSRYAGILGYNILGGFSKLLKYFERNYEWTNIITYADRRWSTGNVYLKNNFVLNHISKPNYWYFDRTNVKFRYHRYSFRKSELKKLFPEIYNESLSEREIMRKARYNRIYDCGNYVFTYKNTLTD